MFVVAAFYKFAKIPNISSYKALIAKEGCSLGVRGSILLAEEGVNGTIAGTREGIDRVTDVIRTLPGCSTLEYKESAAENLPFKRLKVRLKKEIITMGEAVDAVKDVGTYVDPEDWNALLDDPDVVLVDTRNSYEISIGTFKGAIDPEIETFSEMPKRIDQIADGLADKVSQKKLAMFCTGGIRCEKSTAYAKSLGFAGVYHLKGGILKYLEVVPAEQSKWQGACYVFDDRVSIVHGLKKGTHIACAACGRPVSEEQQSSEHYIEGVQCPACVGEYSEEQRARFKERQRQIELAEARGRHHFGPQSS
ncbi:MAG: rhodanese-related sulfurtransferase [Pseudomonadota bacterium]